MLTAYQLLPLMMAEVTYVHQRGQVFGAYWSIQSIISNTLTLASSYEVAALSWRWYYGIMAIAGGFGLILAIFFAFETRFHRPPTYMDGQVVLTDEFGNTRIMTDDEYQRYSAAHGDAHSPDASSSQPKTYPQLLNPWPSKASNASRIVATSFLEMARCCTAPGIVYAILVPSVTTGCMIAMSLSYNAVLTENYGQPAASVGLINLASIPASFAAMFVAGYVGDKLSIALARRNGGAHEPEHRLLPLAFGGVVGFAGLLAYALRADNADGKAGWIVIYVAWGLYLFAFVLSFDSVDDVCRGGVAEGAGAGAGRGCRDEQYHQLRHFVCVESDAGEVWVEEVLCDFERYSHCVLPGWRSCVLLESEVEALAGEEGCYEDDVVMVGVVHCCQLI